MGSFINVTEIRGELAGLTYKLKLTLLAKGPLPCLFLLLVQSQSEYSRVINYVQIIWSKDLFSQVDVITKILNSKIFKYFEFIEYFDDVKKNVLFNDFDLMLLQELFFC